MNLAKVKKLEKVIENKDNIFPQNRDFERLKSEDLDKYIRKQLDEYHREHKLRSLSQAVEFLRVQYWNGLFTRDEFEVLRKGETEFWKVQ